MSGPSTASTPQPTPIVVFAGARSPEHDVSIASASQVVAALDRGRWEPWLVLLDRDDSSCWVREAAESESAAPAFTHDVASADGWSRHHLGAALARLQEDEGVRVAFPVLHGPYGEDGTIQGLCALLDLPCVGSGVAASAVGMDKIRTRECLSVAGIPMAPAYIGRESLQNGDHSAAMTVIADTLGFPCFAKTDTSGSSLGVERIVDAAGLGGFFTRNSGLGRRYLVEAAVTGEEISVPVLGNCDGELQALPPIGIYPRNADHFSHEAKYQPDATEEVVPPRGLDAESINAVQALAVRCHRALCCDGMSRTDMIVTKAGPIVLEVNTLPGMTPASLLPKSAAHAGIDFATLLDQLLELALQRGARP